MKTKYEFSVDNTYVKRDIDRLINQIWKLIPMRENEENWQFQLETVIIELVGLHEILNFNEKFLILLSKLEGLKNTEIEFAIYRKTIFETMSLLGEFSKL